MFGNHFIADRIAKMFFAIDVHLRRRFINRIGIFNEDAYTVLFAEHINLWFGGILPSFVYSEQLDRQRETKYGCDCIVIFRYDNSAKIGLFEAKWPLRSGWDYQQGANPSHFTNQLQRQHLYNNSFAIWEMFYDNRPIPSSWIPSNVGSSCAWHEDAYNFQMAHVVSRTWTRIDLARLLATYGRDLYQIIYTILMCDQGKLLNIKENLIEIDHEEAEPERIPIPLNLEQGIETNESIREYMRKNNLNMYLFYDLTDF